MDHEKDQPMVERALRSWATVALQAAPDVQIPAMARLSGTRRRYRTPVAIGSSILAVAALVIMLVLLPHWISRHPVPVGTYPTTTPGQYWYTDVIDVHPGPHGGQVTLESKTWSSASAYYTVSTTLADTGTPGEPAGSVHTYTSHTPRTFPFGALRLTWNQYVNLPSNPTQLKATMLGAIGPTYQGRGLDFRLWYTAEHILFSPAPLAVRHAAFQIAITVPGVTNLGRVTDTRGRVGIGMQMHDPADGQPWTEIIDPTTYQTMQEVVSGPSGLGGTTTLRDQFTNQLGVIPPP